MQSQFIYDRKALRTSAFLLLLTAAQGAFAADSVMNGFLTLVQWVSGIASILIVLYWILYGMKASGGHHHDSEKMQGLIVGSVIIIAAYPISTMLKTWFA